MQGGYWPGCRRPATLPRPREGRGEPVGPGGSHLTGPPNDVSKCQLIISHRTLSHVQSHKESHLETGDVFLKYNCTKSCLDSCIKRRDLLPVSIRQSKVFLVFAKKWKEIFLHKNEISVLSWWNEVTHNNPFYGYFHTQFKSQK